MTRFLFLAVALLALSVPVQAGIIFDFNDVGTLNYVTGANPLVGTGLTIKDVTGQGTPINDGTTLLVTSSTMSFQTGNYIGSNAGTEWIFDQGGSFTINGIVNGQPTSLLASGKFTGNPQVIDLGAGMGKVFGGATFGFLNNNLASFY